MVATTVTSIFLNQDDRVPDDSRGKLFLVESRFLEKKSVSEIYQTPDLKKLRNFKKTGENLVGSRFFGLPNAPINTPCNRINLEVGRLNRFPTLP